MDLKEAQKKVDEWFEKSGSKKWPKFVIFARIIEEMGEIGKCMNVREGYQKKKVSELDDEFGDALFSLIALANEYNLDLNEVMEKVFEKYNKYI